MTNPWIDVRHAVAADRDAEAAYNKARKEPEQLRAELREVEAEFEAEAERVKRLAVKNFRAGKKDARFTTKKMSRLRDRTEMLMATISAAEQEAGPMKAKLAALEREKTDAVLRFTVAKKIAAAQSIHDGFTEMAPHLAALTALDAVEREFISTPFRFSPKDHPDFFVGAPLVERLVDAIARRFSPDEIGALEDQAAEIASDIIDKIKRSKP